MKSVSQYLFVIFATTFFISSVWQSVIIVNFYMHQDEIAATHCINKAVPESNCKGRCHLKKQLQITPLVVEDNNKATQTSSKTALILLVYANVNDQQNSDFSRVNESFFDDKIIATNAIQNTIFTPPQVI